MSSRPSCCCACTLPIQAASRALICNLINLRSSPLKPTCVFRHVSAIPCTSSLLFRLVQLFSLHVDVQMLMSGLGWPVAEAHHPAAAPAEDGLAVRRTMQGPGLQSIHDELKLQVHSLQVVRLVYTFLHLEVCMTETVQFCSLVAGLGTSSTVPTVVSQVNMAGSESNCIRDAVDVCQLSNLPCLLHVSTSMMNIAHYPQPFVMLQIGVSMKHNQSNLQAMQAAGGFVAITQLLQWTAFSFTLDASENRTSSRSSSAEKDAHRHASLAMSPATHQSGIVIVRRDDHDLYLALLQSQCLSVHCIHSLPTASPGECVHSVDC